MTFYLSLKSYLGAFLEILTIALIMLAAATIILWILPFTWPAAAAMTALFAAVATPLAVIGITVGNVLNISATRGIPQKPACFDKNTKIKLKKGYTTIENINVGDIIHDGSKVTAKFKMSTYGHTMYKLNKLIISGSHKIFYKHIGWIQIRDHPGANIMQNYQESYMYCLNTDSKRIRIDEHVLLDWDDIDDLDFVELKNLASNFIPISASTKSIHKNLEGGFINKTLIELEDGRVVNISDVKINDHLRFGQRVLGIVEIDTRKLKNIYEYKINNKSFVGGANLWINDNDLGKFSTLGLNDEKMKIIDKTDKLYHILTDTGDLIIDGITFMDYNSAIEQIMGDCWSENETLVSL